MLPPNDFSVRLDNKSGAIAVGDNLRKVQDYLGEGIARVKEAKNGNISYFSWQGIDAYYIKKSGVVYKISISSSEFRTARGLRVGQSLRDAKKLYGEPNAISEIDYYYAAAKDVIWAIELRLDHFNKIEEIILSVAD